MTSSPAAPVRVESVQIPVEAGRIENLAVATVVRGSVASDQGLIEGTDYEVDYDAGTIRLLRVPMVKRPSENVLGPDGQPTLVDVPLTHVTLTFSTPARDDMAPARARRAAAQETVITAARTDPTLLALLELRHPDLAELAREKP